MKLSRRKRITAASVGLLAFVAAALHPGMGLTHATEAAFNDAVWTRASVGAGEWPTSGYGRSSAGTGVVTDNLLIIGTQQPIPGASAQRNETAPGKTTHAPSLGSATILFFQVSSRNASACGAYLTGASNPADDCNPAPTPHDADASTSFSNLTGRVNLAGLVGLYTVIQTSGTITGAARCDNGSPTAVAPAGNNLSVGSLNIPIPTSNGTTSYLQTETLLRPRIAADITRTVQTSSNGARSYLHIRLDVRFALLVNGVIDITLVDAECNLGGPSPFAAMSALSQPVLANAGRFAHGEEISGSTTDTDTTTDGEEPGTSESHESPDASPAAGFGDSLDDSSAASTGDTAPSEPQPAPAPIPVGPSLVAVGDTFILRSLDGNELGTARVEGVTYPGECAIVAAGTPVAIRLSVTTSADTSADRLSGITPASFGVLSGDGTLARFTSSPGSCTGTAPAVPAAMEPSRSYSGWIVLDVRDTSAPLVFQPKGTPGWTFALPHAPATPVTPLPTETTAGPEPTAEPVATPIEPAIPSTVPPSAAVTLEPTVAETTTEATTPTATPEVQVSNEASSPE
ncbi:hypothetical protein ONR57_09195 [Hoyosella sp. YIM 151337]|uniref:hypothetical protein n=1 Tax=Hoyosella sp. YIM 151337 TaxID=2992742 RepID=UPI00223642CA|nr:hypothetical protein [Hoyosella sp. YIM 151337]MCW4353470.1 hypothetical protein [Hoyosella sp. YIM 151337]